jgi:hypothetical protein
VVAETTVPYLRPPAQKDVGHQFLEHTILLNDVLVGLVLALRERRATPPASLPFRWLCEEDGTLEFHMFHRHSGTSMPAVLKPDAILEIPGQQRRLFLEAETGAHSIATANPGYHGAVLQKLQRYAHFCTALAGEGTITYYARAYRDGLFPVLIFLVHSAERKRRVEQAIADWVGAQKPTSFRARVLTFEESPQTLSEFIRNRRTATPTPSHPAGTGSDEARARQLRDGYNALAVALNAARRAIAEHNARGGCRVELPPAPVEAFRALRDLIRSDLLGEQGPALTAKRGGSR